MSIESAAHKECFLMDIRRCYDLFLTDRKVSGCRESTLRFYEYVIGKLIHYLTSTDSDSSVEDLQTHILPFFQHLQQQNLSPSTYIENGGDPFSLQRILGHTNQETTSKYVNMARTNVKSQHSKYSPGEWLR